MVMSINLLPKKFLPKKSFITLSKDLKLFNYIASFIFFASVFVFVGIIVINQTRISSLTKKNDTLESSIKNLSQVESQYTLLKMRASYFNEIYGKRGVLSAVDDFEKVLLGNSQILIEKSEIQKDKKQIMATAANSYDLGNFINNMISLGIYKEIIMDSFSFLPGGAYSVTLNLK